ncbi:hypothetical protein CEUSTIGMA_g6620.t1 [Chlamydomonas eustigma]|uniref:Poly A polymerase head domain-containing protein n=1 Tax=Chlamydomonas eustigma TaxID=1157962 RepID=A0A250X8T1_9CHLO|nr:hypothetical protein CEUSTIGMA_g6620.t1 [Chlamydomonas eustigma]|eukprot:GAX79180.1 hypothetical protein CEUSTIGMA_g6620.t1 [Chlamydomonas eustigma]
MLKKSTVRFFYSSFFTSVCRRSLAPNEFHCSTSTPKYPFQVCKVAFSQGFPAATQSFITVIVKDLASRWSCNIPKDFAASCNCTIPLSVDLHIRLAYRLRCPTNTGSSFDGRSPYHLNSKFIWKREVSTRAMSWANKEQPPSWMIMSSSPQALLSLRHFHLKREAQRLPTPFASPRLPNWQPSRSITTRVLGPDMAYKAKAPQPVRYPLPAINYTEEKKDEEAYKDAKDLIMKLQAAGFSAFIAGGWVRDRFMGRVATDIDISTNAKLPELIRELGTHCVHQLHPNTARVSHGMNKFEVSSFKGCQREPDNFSAYLDAVFRDYTINALLYDPIRNEVLDYTGAVEDITNKVLRMCEVPREWQNGPLSNLQDDPVRLLRGVRLMVQLQLQLHPRTLQHMKLCSSQLIKQDSLRLVLSTGQASKRGIVTTTEASYGRVWRELLKVASLENDFKGAFSASLRQCRVIDLLDKLFPFLDNNVLASKAWEVQSRMPKSVPLELRIMGLVNPFSNASILEFVINMLNTTAKGIKDHGGKPQMELAQLYQEAVEIVMGFYSVPQNLSKGAWIRFLSHKNSQDIVSVMAAWLAESTPAAVALDTPDAETGVTGVDINGCHSQPGKFHSQCINGDGDAGRSLAGRVENEGDGQHVEFLNQIKDMRIRWKKEICS